MCSKLKSYLVLILYLSVLFFTNWLNVYAEETKENIAHNVTVQDCEQIELDSDYEMKVKDIILEYFDPPLSALTKTTSNFSNIKLSIDSKGIVKSVMVSSGDDKLDKYFLEAIEKSQPLPVYKESLECYVPVKFGITTESIKNELFTRNNMLPNISNSPQILNEYMKNIDKSITIGWKPPILSSLTKSNYVVIQFAIERSGETTDVQLVESSGNKTLDKKAVQFINDLSFPPLPDSIKADFINKKVILSVAKARIIPIPILLPF